MRPIQHGDDPYPAGFYGAGPTSAPGVIPGLSDRHSEPADSEPANSATATVDGSKIRKLIVACDAGMGSSVLLASALKRQLASTAAAVTHSSIAQIPVDADLVLTQRATLDRAREIVPGVQVVPFAEFRDDPTVAKIVEAIRSGTSVDVQA